MKGYFEFILNNYIDFYNKMSTVQDLDSDMKDIISKKIPNSITEKMNLDTNRYEVRGSYGMGNYTETPWIAIFDKRIAVGAQKGFYAVFLFKKDMSGFYLSLNQGTKYLKEKFKNQKPRIKMNRISTILREELYLALDKFPLTKIELVSQTLNSKNYMSANICAKYYSVNKFKEENLIEDLKVAMRDLEKIVSYIGGNTTADNIIGDFIDGLLFKESISDIKYQEDILLATSSETECRPRPRPDSNVRNGTKKWKRDPSVAKEALKKSNYTCEINDSHVTFESLISKEQYVEAHHLIPIHRQCDFKYSIDVPGNIVALCPNCHRKIHHAISKSKKKIIEYLYGKKREEFNTFGLNVSLEKLYKYYDVE